MVETGSSSSRSPWHEGERAVQRRAGVPDAIEDIGRIVFQSSMTEQHRRFFAQLPFLVVGSIDGEGRPWASLLAGRPGFAHSPDPEHLTVRALPAPGDPLAGALRVGAALGTLGIELPTRRRNRMNGTVSAVDAEGFTVRVEESFGNCPQYIQRRDYGAERSGGAVEAEMLTGLDAAARAAIRRADTSFVASAARRVDVSHRGGQAGFLGIAEDGAIVVPDFSGNRYFNTLGNLAVNPRAGLLIPDFASGDLLQLTGTTETVWDGPELRAIAGAERLWRLTVTGGNRLRGALPMAFRFGEYSPRSLATGVWQAA
jgi:predicted pyridoxine 5'-phosphate oxidase superfamily flavin-nucleotide-binding protein